MDPAFIDNQMWHDLSTMLRFLWVYMLFIIGFALNFLTAHAIIPSLVDSGQLPRRIAQTRPLFYLSALGILVIAVGLLVVTVVEANVVARIWSQMWI